MKAYSLFGLTATVILMGGYLWLDSRADWHPYAVWTVVASVVAFGLYSLDKLLSTMSGRKMLRVPEAILHLVAVVGGVWGAWLGMFLWRHKTNWGKHPAFPVVLILTTLIHLGLAYYWLL